jgi:hypothetical protein
MIKMGQHKQGSKECDMPGRSDLSKFEYLVQQQWLNHRHLRFVMGALTLRTRWIEWRTGFELCKAALSDCIQSYEKFLPLDQFDDSASNRHNWIHHLIRNLYNGLREIATRTVKDNTKKANTGGGKRKAEGSSDEHPPKGSNIEVANIQNKSFVVWVHGNATSGSLLRSFQGLEEYSQLLQWIAKARPMGPFTLQMVYCCQLSEDTDSDAAVTVGQELQSRVWIKETWNGEVQNFRTVAP